MNDKHLPPIPSNLLPPVTNRFTDDSTAKYFQFTFYCDHCGAGRQSPPHFFSAADDVTDIGSMTDIQRLIYSTEYENAYEQANKDAIGYFFACTQCGNYICEDCALPSSPGDVYCPGCMTKHKADNNDNFKGGNNNGG